MIVRKQFRRGKGAPFGAEQQQLLRREGVYRNADADAKQGSAGWNPNPSAYALVTASKRARRSCMLHAGDHSGQHELHSIVCASKNVIVGVLTAPRGVSNGTRMHAICVYSSKSE